MLRTLLILMTVLSFTYNVRAQGEATFWYFGDNAGIKFEEDGTITPLLNGQLSTIEGCTSISDEEGNLLLYTDGITVFNKDHQVIANGTELYGDPSSSQSGLIVPKPGDPSIQYVFTVDASAGENPGNFGLNYTIVDLDGNAGRGRVQQKNIQLLEACSEKITAVLKDCSNRSVWVVAFAGENGDSQTFDTFFAYEVTPAGVNRTPVKSRFEEFGILDPRGYLKFSTDGTKVASANSLSGLYLYDFDVATGVVSNAQRIRIEGPNRLPYGVEFSQSRRFLYVHASNNESISEPEGHESSLLQFDLRADDIAASMIEIDNRPVFRGALQLGFDGKIYRTISRNYLEGSPYLGVINEPERLGEDANYEHDAIFLEGRNGRQGLPPFIQSFFYKVGLFRNADGTTETLADVCFSEQLTLEVDPNPNATFIWRKDGTLIPNNSNTLEIASVDFTDAGTYTLEIIPDDPKVCVINGEAEISVNQVPVPEPQELTQCDLGPDDPNDGLTIINLLQISENEDFEYTFYKTTQDAIDGNPIPNPERYENTTPFSESLVYQVRNQVGCGGLSTLHLTVTSTIVENDPPLFFYGCDNDPSDTAVEGIFDLSTFVLQGYENSEVNFYANLEDASLEINPLELQYTSAEASIFARIENNNQCETVKQINLVVNPTPAFEFPDQFIRCTDGPELQITAPEGFDLYRWWKIEEETSTLYAQGRSTSFADAGEYRLEVGIEYGVNQCYGGQDFSILPSNRATITDIEITDFSKNNTVSVSVEGDGDYLYSLDGVTYQEEPFFEGVDPGFISVFVQDNNGCGVTEEEISVLGYPSFFTPNGDAVNDSWKIIGVSENIASNSFITIYDRFGKLIKQMTMASGWNGLSEAGQQLPADSYWFVAEFEQGRTHKGFFALKR
ncbi:MAG: T9SS type B sorting domain-containing protein [Bacteroidota bacterium]